MTSSDNGRRLVIAIALVGIAGLQGCAVMTGVYIPDRSPTTSHSMVSRFDERLMRSESAPSASSSLHMPREQASGLFYLRY
ncbi:MAG: hypothetical protein M3Z10_01915 [Gemmatimonadota bacterium]|nr:hypothetical protein [Gemmatimonadota bacterium]